MNQLSRRDPPGRGAAGTGASGPWKREVRVETFIAAPAERVWALLLDVASYPSWNRFMPRVVGVLAPGAEVKAEVRFRRGFLGIPLRFRAQVLRCDECREVRWTGKLLFRWLFSGVHSFVLEPAAASGAVIRSGTPSAGGRAGAAGPEGPGVVLVHREELHGVLLPLLGWYLAPLMEEGFREMNEALRARAEVG